MKKDINIVPIFLDESNKKINLDKAYPVFKEDGEDYFKLALMVQVNGVPLRDYNIYCSLSSFDNHKNQTSLILGGFSLKSGDFYNNSSVVSFKSSLKENMTNIFKVGIHKIEKNKDISKLNMEDGFLKRLNNKDLDIGFILKNSTKLAETDFHLS